MTSAAVLLIAACGSSAGGQTVMPLAPTATEPAVTATPLGIQPMPTAALPATPAATPPLSSEPASTDQPPTPSASSADIGPDQAPTPTPLQASAEAAPDVRAVQEISITESIYPGYFDPAEITVKVGVPVRLLVSALQREHVNRISVLPWIEASGVLGPGGPVAIEFTPDVVGDYRIRNIGHGFEATLHVVE